MAVVGRETKLLKTEVVAMVRAVDHEAADLLEAATWTGPRWHVRAGRVVLAITLPDDAAVSRVMGSLEACAVLEARLTAVTFGAPWVLTWVRESDQGAMAPDEGARAMMDVAAAAWAVEPGAKP